MRNVDNIVTDEGDLVVTEPVFVEEGLIDPDLFQRALVDLLDTQFPGAHVHDLGLSAGDDPDDDPRPLGKLDAVSVTDMERLELVALVVQDDPAVGQYAVHVEQEQLDLLRFGSEGLVASFSRCSLNTDD